MPSDISIVAWSLEVEAQFYILAPALALFFAIRRPVFRRTALVVAILVMISIGLIGGDSCITRLSFLGYGQYLLAGFLLADLYLSGGEYRRHNRLCDLVALLAGVCLLIALVAGGAAVPWLTPWLIALFLATSFHGVIVNKILTHPIDHNHWWDVLHDLSSS
jgi:peptidoglycan/LPS O-acetylase OafA/YrhL